MTVTFCNSADITVALHVYTTTTTISCNSTTLTAIARCRIPLPSHNVYVRNTRAEGVKLHVAVTRVRQTAMGCAKTNSIHVLTISLQFDAACKPRPCARIATILF